MNEKSKNLFKITEAAKAAVNFERHSLFNAYSPKPAYEIFAGQCGITEIFLHIISSSIFVIYNLKKLLDK